MSIDQMRKPEEIEAELDRIRARMDATLEEIEHRLTPRAFRILAATNALLRFAADMEAQLFVHLVLFTPAVNQRPDTNEKIRRDAHASSSDAVRRNAFTASEVFSQAAVSTPSCRRPAGVRR